MPYVVRKCRRFSYLQTAVFVFAVVNVIWADAVFERLGAFPIPYNHSGPFVHGRDGYLYGGTLEGGRWIGGGAIFRFKSSERLSYVHEFRGSPFYPVTNIGGCHPEGRFAVGEDGSICGVTRDGGIHKAGAIFKISTDGKFEVLYNFPYHLGSSHTGVVTAPSGDYFGWVNSGGPAGEYVFRLSPGGIFETLYTFGSDVTLPQDSPEGYLPARMPTSLIQGMDGMLYGTTWYGGYSEIENGSYIRTYGTVYRLDMNGNATLLAAKEFSSATGSPYNLAEGMDGKLYVATEMSVFQIEQNGTVTLIHQWNNTVYPRSLFCGSDGNIYGATSYGGINNYGVIFKISHKGEYSEVYQFDKSAYGLSASGFVEDSDGWFYGVVQSPKPFFVRFQPGALTLGNIPPMAREDRILLDKIIVKKNTMGPPRVEIPVLKNDRDNEGDLLTISSFAPPLHGSASFDPVKKLFEYSIPSVQSDEFSYTITDGHGGISTGDVLLLPTPAGKYHSVLTGSVITSATCEVSLNVSSAGRIIGKLGLGKRAYTFVDHINNADCSSFFIKSGKDKTIAVELQFEPLAQSWNVVAKVTADEGVFEGNCSLVPPR